MKITPEILTVAFGMPPEQAVAYLRSKGLVVSNSWRDLLQTAHQRAFTVARSAGYDVLGDIRDALTDALEKGRTVQQFIDTLKPVLQARGWWGRAIDPKTGEILQHYENSTQPVMLGSPRRLKLIYEQNLQTAYMAGRYRSMIGGLQTHPYWQYVAVMDRRTRPAHAALNGRVFGGDDVVWSVAYPPNGWRCRCVARPLTASAVRNEGLSVETGEGHIIENEVPLRKGGVAKVKSIKLPGMDKPFTPDVGWDYNPAQAYHDGASYMGRPHV